MNASTSILTRAVAAVSAAAFVAGAAGAASAQAYRQPTGGSIGSVLDCDAPGGQQAGGAAIGAVLGAVLGSNLSRDNRTAGAAIGALAGAAGGSYIGCKRQRDRVNQNAYGYGPSYAPAQPAGYRDYDRSAGGAYVATATVNVRAAATTRSPVVGQVRAGQSLRVVGRSGDWIVVDAGRGVGYVHAAYVRSADYVPARYQSADYRY